MITFVLTVFALWVGIGIGWGTYEVIVGRHERHRRYGSDRPRDFIAFFFISAFLGCFIFFGMMLDGA